MGFLSNLFKPTPSEPSNDLEITVTQPEKVGQLVELGAFHTHENLFRSSLDVASLLLRLNDRGLRFRKNIDTIEFDVLEMDTAVRQLIRDTDNEPQYRAPEDPISIHIDAASLAEDLKQFGEFKDYDQMLEFSMNAVAHWRRFHDEGWELEVRATEEAWIPIRFESWGAPSI